MIKHLAVIMDGNRRWASTKGVAKMLGHREGTKAIEHAVDFCLDTGIAFLSLYTFSLENFNRSKEEKTYLFELILEELNNSLDTFIDKQIRICFIGDRTLFPNHLMDTINNVEMQTKNMAKLQLNLLFCYGAQQEIMDGIKTLVHKIKKGEVQEESLSEKDFEQCLWSAGIPDPDIIIRTGGRQRLSNFLLYQAAYSEFCFLDCLWPDMTVSHFKDAVDSFASRTRNFGE